MLTVLNVAYPLAPVGFDTAGGSEQIISLLDAALVEKGHHSVILGCEGSAVKGDLITTSCTREFFAPSERGVLYQEYRAALRRAIETYEPDVIHLHGVDVHEYLPPAGVPALITLHLPPAWYSPQVFRAGRPQTYLNCVSASQQKTCPAANCLLPFVGNGIAVDAFRPRMVKSSFALVLARVCPEKGIHLAIDSAALAQVPILIGGEIFPYKVYETYFRDQVAPRLGPNARFLGPVGFQRKRRLLAAARCLLVPALAPETSSLVAMEALACGTPVIAFSAGALPEIVEDGVTGFLVSSEREMAEAIHNVGQIDPARCRRAAEERFSSAKMVRRYLQVYKELAQVKAVPERAASLR